MDGTIRRTSPAVWAGLFVVAPLATAACTAALIPLWRSDPPLALSVVVLFAGLFSMGVALFGEPGQSTSGTALLGSALLLAFTWSEEWNWGAVPWISKTVGNEWLFLGAWALYRYPRARLSRWDRQFFAVMAAWFFVPQVLLLLTSRPQWHSYHADLWWPTLWPDRPLWRLVDNIDSIGLLVLALTYLTRWAQGLITARPLERRMRLPAGIAAILATIAAALVPIGLVVRARPATMDRIYLIEAAAMVVVPIAFLVAILRRQVARARVTQLILGIKGPPSTDAVLAALRAALQDPTLELAYFDPASSTYRSADGALAPQDQPERQVAVIDTSRGVPLALLLADPALVRDPDLLAAAATVAGFSLEIARLIETVRDQLSQVQAASTRAVQASDAERRRLAQDLHDGAQQHLLALGPLIGAAEASTNDPSTAGQLSEIRGQLAQALKELRDFSHGVHPSSLSHGLATAVGELARRLPIATAVTLDGDPLPKETAHAAYLVISEALANAAKHSHAATVTISGRVQDGLLTVQVRDDGVGGAHLQDQDAGLDGKTGGQGIANMRDRTAALGGRFRIDSPPGQGTTVELSLPCG